jgi:hypothetical protein
MPKISRPSVAWCRQPFDAQKTMSETFTVIVPCTIESEMSHGSLDCKIPAGVNEPTVTS